MKKFIFAAMFLASALLAQNASADTLTFAGSLTLNWTVYTQEFSNKLESTKTNYNGKTTNLSTNVVRTYTSAYKSSPFNNASFLDLLSNSFRTTFPPGSKLATDGSGVYVVDRTGTNIILAAPTNILNITVSGYIASGASSTVSNFYPTGISLKSNGSSSGFAFFSATYNDSLLQTSDGTTTQFTFTGLASFGEKSTTMVFSGGYFNGITDNLVAISGTQSQNFSILNGAGTGTLRGRPATFKGSIVAGITSEPFP
jgi:hypothetical protein